MSKPLILGNYALETIWQGERMHRIRQLDKPYGIYREVSTYAKEDVTDVIASAYPENSLLELLANHRTEVIGDSQNNQLLKLAYIDAKDSLSIQVHPDEEYAQTVGDHEKSEAWYILDCAEDSFVYAGVEVADKAELLAHIENNTLEEKLIKIPVQKGDFVYIPCNLIHACGPDILALEVSGYGGITYRIYDYGRPRQLDTEIGLEVVDISKRATVFRKPEVRGNEAVVAVNDHTFRMTYYDIDGSVELDTENKYRIITNIEGDIEVIVNGEKTSLDYTFSLIVPASAGKYIIIGKGKVLVTSSNT